MSDIQKEEPLMEEQKKSDPPIHPKSGKSVAIYLAILFIAAFCLLLLAFFQQQRSTDEMIGNLQQSVSQFQTVEELRKENQQLREQVEEYEALIEELLDIGFLQRGEDGNLQPAPILDPADSSINFSSFFPTPE